MLTNTEILQILKKNGILSIKQIIDNPKFTDDDVMDMIESISIYFDNPDKIMYDAIKQYNNSNRNKDEFYASEFIINLLINNPIKILTTIQISREDIFTLNYVNGHLYTMNWTDCKYLLEYLDDNSIYFKHFVRNSFNQLCTDSDYDNIWDDFNFNTFEKLLIKYKDTNYMPFIDSDELYIKIFGNVSSVDINNPNHKLSIINITKLLNIAHKHNIKNLFDDNNYALGQLSNLGIPKKYEIDNNLYFK